MKHIILIYYEFIDYLNFIASPCIPLKYHSILGRDKVEESDTDEEMMD